MIHRLITALMLALGLFTCAAANARTQDPTAEQRAFMERMETLQADLHPQTGQVTVREADVTLALGEAYYFLSGPESRRVLIEAWGNPPDSVRDVIGMIFPAGKTFTDETWGAVLTYVADGYVSDHDAAGIDYAALLNDMRAGEDQDNEARRAAGFGASHLVGWAQEPSYDARRHTLIWAKEVRFSDSGDINTLNYDVRVLGRRGVFSMNLVTGMNALSTTRTAATELMGTATFNDGARYTDYVEGQDRKAAYGVAGLIAGGAAVAVAKKAGLLGILLLVLKKGAVFILAGAGAAFAWLRNLFAGRKGATRTPTYTPDVPTDTHRTETGLEPIAPTGDDAAPPDDRDKS